MEPIHVLPTPSQAFNKNRRISDLIRAQVQHLKHLENKLPAEVRQQLPQHPIVTEEDAARYIGPMTRLLRSLGTASALPANVVPLSRAKPQQPSLPSQSLNIAASAKKAKSKTDIVSRKGKKP